MFRLCFENLSSTTITPPEIVPLPTAFPISAVLNIPDNLWADLG